MTDWKDAVDRHRETLEKLVEHGKTPLADDAERLLEEYEKQ